MIDFRALGTGVAVRTTDPSGRAVALAVVESELAAIDAACSRFRDDSELTRLNRAEGQPLRVSPLFLEALSAGLRAAEATDGLVTPTVGVALRWIGYDRDFAEIGGDGGIAPSARTVPAWRALRIDHDRSEARLLAGVEIDLGATAKALAADRAAVAVARATGMGALVSVGGDLAIAGPPPTGGWAVRVAEDHGAATGTPGDETISLNSGGLATSSTTVRRWRRGEQEMHHIVNPATGLPARVYWRTATVGAATCLDANIASTAAIILGRAAPRWLEARGLPARLFSRDGRIHLVGAWPRSAGKSQL
jgi:thiamine biosynthesis lipoprotein